MAAKAASLTTRVAKPRPRWVRRVKRIFATLFLLFLIAFVVVGVVFVRELRHASELMGALPDKLRQLSTKPTTIVSADGKILYQEQEEFRQPIRIADVPKRVTDAILAAEDRRFYTHSGVDYWAMGRIVVVGAEKGRLSQGGSTLTMQLAKRFYSEGEKTMNRKLQDVALAITMEHKMTKDQILELYLNTMYFGEKAYGIGAAAQVYFGKQLNDLSVAECAMLARCVRRPSDENPVKNLEKAITNRNVVLGIMRDEKMINEDEYQKAIDEEVHLTPHRERISTRMNAAPYFVSHVLQFLAQDMPDLDLKQGGYTIYTTLDSGMEKYAEQQIRDFVHEHRGDRVNDAAFVLMDKEGKILAEAGGLDFNKDQYNIITQGRLQPGSSFKPFMYATALNERVLSMNDTLGNRPFVYPGTESYPVPWRPQNSDPKREDRDSVSVDTAMALSMNVAAAHVMERVGPSKVADYCTGVFGFTSKINRFPSLALGATEVHPLEMAQGYSVFMLRGSRATPYVVTKIVGADGDVLKNYSPNVVPNQLDSWVCDDIDQLLESVVTHGTAYRAHLFDIPNARGKTGTTSDHKDAWFCGYTDGLVGVGWVGNNVVDKKGRATQLPMARSMWGATTAAGIWKNIMARAHEKFASPIIRPEENGANRGPKTEEGADDTTVKAIPPDDTTAGTTGGDTVPPGGPPTQATTGGDVGGGGTGGANTAGGPPPTTTGATPPDQPPVEKPPAKRDPPKRHDESDTVQVEVCAESGMRATIYCPETITRTFKRGQEPRRHCPIHGG